MTAHEYLAKAERCEKAAAELYEHLARVFASDPEAARVFARLADEEHQHAARLRMIGSLHHLDRALFRKGIAVPDVDAALRLVESALRDARAGAWGTDLETVLGRAAALEEEFGEFHAASMARVARPELQEFFSKLQMQDDVHRQLLLGASRARRGSR